jgi:uncharacterized membrane protein YeaQ/YmgE (transglycosylase-associated protein family)
VLLLVLIALVLVVVLGIVILGVVLKLLWWALIGLVIGAFGRLVLPGQQTIGLLGTIGSGIGGALLGGILGHAFGWGGLGQFLLAIAVAAGLIALFGGTRRAYA